MAQSFNCTVATGLLGWVDQPNQRGTIDILLSCLLIIFASTWTVLHVHLPAEDESQCHILIRKLRWSLFTIFAPEIIIATSSCQWASAQASVKAMREQGASNWTVVHGFFADSGGFVLHPPDTPPFPVNTRAIHYLVSKNYIEPPSVTQQHIWDRSKADNFAKIVACVQSGYMVAQCLTRAAQSLQIPCLELLTVAFVFCTCISYYFWMDKPLGAESAIHLSMETDMAVVLLRAQVSPAYHDTPMDFVEQPGWSLWRRRPYWKTFGGLNRRPIDRIPNDYYPPPPTLLLAIPVWLATVAFGGIHLAGWNFEFPTVVELWVWRIASLTAFVLLLVLGLVQVLDVKPGINLPMTFLGVWKKTGFEDTSHRRWLINTLQTLGFGLYFLTRLMVITEAFASMRRMDATAYQTVNWTNYWPHL